jgi:hypothetical protein
MADCKAFLHHLVLLGLVLDERWLQELLAGGIKVSAGFSSQVSFVILAVAVGHC